MAFPKAIQLTDDQIREARKLRIDPHANGRVRSWRNVAKLMGVQEMAMLRAMSPIEAARRSSAIPSKRTERFLTAKDFQGRAGVAITIPVSVLEERDRTLAMEHTTLTAARMGDPLPGRSALDRKRMEHAG